ncbi:MAG: hypothetical protein R3300_21340, partial [Candidatus Promineifilaceae bacterium]|nr:hypothetical protein [Candidatus Promineifilaceae bacterium]
FICLIFYFTGRQVNWGRLPSDLSEAEAASLRQDRQVRLGSIPLSLGTPLRLAIATVVILIAWWLARQSTLQLPVVPEHFNGAIFALVALGLLNVSLTAEPLTAGIGLATFLTGFELFYGALEQAAALLAVLAAVNLTVALVAAYLTQVRFAFPAWLDEDPSSGNAP